MKKFFTLTFLLFIGLLFIANNINAQTALGNFSANLKGSFEDATMGTAPSAKTYGAGAFTAWGTFGNASTLVNTQHRTGGTSMMNSSGGGCGVWSPTFPSGAIVASTAYVIQFYYKDPSTSTKLAIPQVSIFDDANNSLAFSSTVSLGLATGVSNWTKITVVATSGSATANYGALRISGGTPSATIYFDDFCVYAGTTADVTAPSWSGSLTATGSNGSVSLSWPTATDGGSGLAGYMIVRNTASIGVTPLVNTIYTVTSGFSSNVPTVTSGDTIGTSIAAPCNVVITYVASGTTTYSDTHVTNGTTYYYNVYALDQAFNYSTVMSGNATPSAGTNATVLTHGITSIGTTTATAGGWIASIGSASVTTSGVCWNTSANPTTANSHTTDGGSYSTSGGWTNSSITGLTGGTLYHLTAYGTNTNGTGYSVDTTFTTLIPVTLADNENGQVAAGSIVTGSNKQALINFKLTVGTSGTGTTLNSVSFTTTGNATGSDLTNFKLYYSTSSTLSSSSQIGSTVTGGGAGTYTFSSLTQAIAAAATGYFWITTDVAGGGTPGNTVTVSALTTSNITLAAGASLSAGTLTAGGQQTVSGNPNITLSDNPGGQVAAGNMPQFTTSNIIYNFELDVTSTNATLNAVSIPTPAGSNNTYASGDLTNLKLWYNSTNNGPGAGATTISTITSPSNAVSQSFSSLTQSISAGASGFFWVTADVAAGAVVGHTITVTPALAFSNLTFSTAINAIVGTINAGGQQSITAGTSAITLSGISTVAPGNIHQSSTKQVLYNFQLAVTNVATTLTQVTIPNTGTYNGSDFTNLKLWYGTSSSISSASTISTISSPSNTSPQTFSSLSQAIAAGATGYFWVTADVAADPTSTIGDAITVTPALAFSNLTFSNSITPTVGTIVAGGQKTIDALPPTTYYRTNQAGNWSNTAIWDMSTDSSSWTTAPGSVPTGSETGVAVGFALTVDGPISETGVIDVEAGSLTTTGGLTIASGGVLKNGVIGSNPITSTTSNLTFSSGGKFQLSAAATTTAAYIPTATWNTGSTCSITGIVGVASTDYQGLNGIAQTFANFDVCDPNLIGYLVLAYNASSSSTNFIINGNFTQESTGSSTWGTQFIASGKNNNILNIGGNFTQSGGVANIAKNTSNSATRIVTVTGNFTLSGTSTFDLLDSKASASSACIGRLQVGGNVNIGSGSTLEGTNYNSSEASLIFNGSGAQQFTCTGTFNPSVTNTNGGVTGVTLNNTVGNGGGLTLNNNLQVNGVLTFTSGVIITGANAVNLIGTATTSPAAITSSYINGTLNVPAVSTGTGTYSHYGVGIAAGSDNIGNVTVVLGTGANGGQISYNAHTSVNRNWTITVDNQPTNGRSVTFTWTSTDDGNNGPWSSGNKAHVFFSTDNGSTWGQYGGQTYDLTGDGGNHSITINGVTHFSQWTITDDQNPFPVEMTTFTANAKGESVTLNWNTASEVNNTGWEVQRAFVAAKDSGKAPSGYENVGFVKGNENSNSPKDYSYLDKSSVQNGMYYYRLQQIDNDGTSKFSQVASAKIDIPLTYAVSQNYPNPFNPSTTINYSIPVSNKVTIKVYNILGDEVTTLVNEQKDAGRYSVTFNASRYASGVYFYRVQSGNFVQTKKMMLLK